MIINSSHVGMESERSYASKSRDAVTKNTYTASGMKGFSSLLFNSKYEREYNGELVESENESTEDLNESASFSLQEQMEAISNRFNSISASIKNNSLNEENDLQAKFANECPNYLLRLLFGKEYENYYNEHYSQMKSNSFNMESSNLFFISGEQKAIKLGTSYEESHYYEEEEFTSFSTKGTVVTADGREIQFNLDLEMSRSFVEYTSIKAENLIEFVDPLVINLNGNIAEVSDQKFYFDLDADGEEDEISQLGPNSGFLALDKNGDGLINDGTELFGAKNGNGFADLAMYDEDNNGWIDEADEIFDKLIIWTKDKDGNDQYLSLKEAGVGAMYTGYSSTNFTLMGGMDSSETMEEAIDNMGKVNAVIKSTGLFLYENGEVGTMQQIDMAKEVS